MKRKTWAVVGATPRQNKYGYQIYRSLKLNGYTAYPVNPRYKEVDGDPCYESLSKLPVVPEVVDMVVSPTLGEAYVEEAAKLDVEFVWFQPGAESEELVEKARNLGLKVVYNTCIMLETEKRK
ncbi:CoA-binding domain-containing protein [Thermoanaerobacter kivui]|uniref:CoA-binding domain-containing protein n=1 Tax=Thermoanaerobacter kivui TaxID=2325 RepID=A0A097AR67_THEKI|nr:CoA-binding domain-containing protein [Thermoanaerobacter kivui]